MTDDERIDEPGESGRVADEITAIPDGGLSDTMPDWLRRPPAWRGMVVPEVPEPTPDPVAMTGSVEKIDGDNGSDAGEASSPARTPNVIPEPDRSPIDPSTLIELSDLPEWLVGLGRRDPSPRVVPDAMRPESVEMVEISESPPVSTGIALRSQEAEASEPFNDAPAGNGMRILVIAGVIVAVLLVAFIIAQFG